MLKSQGAAVGSTHLGSQNKLSQQAKGGVRDVIKLKPQCELFPLLLSEGNSGEKEAREQEDGGSRGLPVQEHWGFCTSPVRERLRHSHLPNSYFACYFLLVIQGSQGDGSTAKSGDVQ